MAADQIETLKGLLERVKAAEDGSHPLNVEVGRAMNRLTDPVRLHHLEHMPLGLVGPEWEPGGAEFEAARASTAKALTKLARVDWPTDEVMDWEVRSWLRQQHYGDPGMAGLRAAASADDVAEARGRRL